MKIKPPGVGSLAQLEKLVCKKLRLKLEYFENGEDYTRLLQTYLAKGEAVIKSVLDQLDDATFGGVFERRNYGPKGSRPLWSRSSIVVVQSAIGDFSPSGTRSPIF